MPSYNHDKMNYFYLVLLLVIIIILLYIIGVPIEAIGVATGAAAFIAYTEYVNSNQQIPKAQVTGGANGKEYEARWIDIDVDKMREKIIELGTTKVHDDKLYKRYIYPLPKGYFRVRSEFDDKGEITTMTSKTYEDPKFPVETEIHIVDDFDSVKKFLDSINMEPKAYHETRREKYSGLAGCNEISIDTLPGLNPYIEIDCTSEERMKEIADSLGLDMADAKYGAFVGVYVDEYGIDKKWFDNELDELKFETVKDKLAEHIVKNKEKFEQIVSA